MLFISLWELLLFFLVSAQFFSQDVTLYDLLFNALLLIVWGLALLRGSIDLVRLLFVVDDAHLNQLLLLLVNVQVFFIHRQKALPLLHWRRVFRTQTCFLGLAVVKHEIAVVGRTFETQRRLITAC